MGSKREHIEPLYAYDEWAVVEERFDEETNVEDETIFALGNGYIGMRGNYEEGFHGAKGRSVKGTYINAFYETEPIRYPEDAYGYARTGQTMINVTDAKPMVCTVDGEPVHLSNCNILGYKRTLDLRNGVLKREMQLETKKGKVLKFTIERLVSLERKHVAAIRYEVTPVNFSGSLDIESSIDGAVRNQVSEGDPRVGAGFAGQVLQTKELQSGGTYGAIRQQTKNSGFTIVCAMDHEIAHGPDAELTIANERSSEGISVRVSVTAAEGQSVTVYKYIAYHTSKESPETADTAKLLQEAEDSVVKAKEDGFETLLNEQAKFLEQYWRHSDVEIHGDIALQQSIRYNAFQLLQSVGRDGRSNIAAKGLTGEGYEGHYFWDTETYIFPFFLYTHPEIGKPLLEYRYSILDKARERARIMSQKGALYAWRTINGEETSAYYPAGTAQYHINADVIYALKKYMAATNDMEFFLSKGAEMLFETARLWADLGDNIPAKGGRFCINDVTGPDEYTAIVNNNAFTNLMAKDHLEFAAKMARRMQAEHRDAYAKLASKIGLDDAEIDEWQRAADLMYVPESPELGIVPQDDSFLEKAVWDFANTPKDKYPLLLHYHPLVIYRHQVLKQADVVLATFLQSHRFTLAEKKRNYDFYEPLTTHDSSLSPCIYSIIAAEIGYKDRAYNYFMQTARMDLDDINGNVKDGVHTAAMAGAWLSIVCGFGGMRELDGTLHFRPTIPEQWEKYRFKVTFGGCLIAVDVTKREAVYMLEEGSGITIVHEHEELSLSSGSAVRVSLEPKLEAVIFDLDGVIVDTAEYHYLGWKKLADELGVPFDKRINERLKGVDRMKSLNIVLEKSERTYTEDEKRTMADKKNRYYVESIGAISPSDILPGIEAFLRELKLRGIKTALASASKNAKPVIERLGIEPYLDVVVDVAKIAKGKPDPEIFMTAAEQLKVPLRNCAGVEDAEAGIEAIKAAGMFAVGVGSPEAMHKADWRVDGTDNLTLDALLERFRAR
ncbi:beta-phosphoglucomutase [Paenibacillus thermotolerans]|uniref:beta-phosphoglucomutase n=1 Tax=Paenibacillus thermotolerans TaxID=3027807 RepID=UPI002367A330|nr:MULTISPECIES: beta-phosphoglucomutase [unclassified Paenibacillus]